MHDPRQRLIVALDVSSAAAAHKIVAAVGDSAFCYKVGMQLYTAEGPQVVRDLVSSGRKVFLDLKYHDIPTTVAAAVREAAQLRVTMLTVHASGRWQDAGRCHRKQLLPPVPPSWFWRSRFSPVWTIAISTNLGFTAACGIRFCDWPL